MFFILLKNNTSRKLEEFVFKCRNTSYGYIGVWGVLTLLRKRIINKIQIFNVIKRTSDIIISLILLIIFSPVFLTIILLIKMDSKGPVLYTQNRVGQYGKRFKIIKFRTMIRDAEKMLKNDPILYQKYLQNGYKLEPHEDPRITKLGYFLRKTSLDELPQLINVLKGDMSIVGPRPIVEEELKEYGEKKIQLLSVKPGITGYWAVEGRSEIAYPKRAELELYYVNNQSFRLDIKILLKTLMIVLKQKGAY